MKRLLNIIIALLLTTNVLFAYGIYNWVKTDDNISWGKFRQDVIKSELLQKLNINK